MEKNRSKSGKQHLSRIVLGSLFKAIAGLLAVLMIFTAVFVYYYAKSKIDSKIRYNLDDVVRIIHSKMWYSLSHNLEFTANDIDGHLEEEGIEHVYDEEVLLYMEGMKNITTPPRYSEISIVDKTGKIIVSTEDNLIGYDLHSGERSAEFLCLLDRTGFYKQDMGSKILDDSSDSVYFGYSMPFLGGFILCGMSEQDFKDYKMFYYEYGMEESRIDKTGYIIPLDSDQEILSAPSEMQIEGKITLKKDLDEMADTGEIIRQDMYGTDAYVGVIKDDDFYLVAVYPAAEAWENWKVSIIVLILIDAIVFALLFFLIRRLMKRQVLDGIEDINDSLTRITGGDLDEKVNFRDSVEFEGLSDGINYTVDRLKGLIKEAEERIDAELALAAKIQTSFLPHKFPAFPDRDEFELYAAMVPAKEVGGDFYDYFFTDEDHLALVIADVSGKGIPAAMFMAVSMDKIRHSVMKYGTDVSGAMTEVNLELLKENDAGLFVTVWLGVINVSTGHVDYVDAGHEYPAICRAGGEFTADEDVHSGPAAALKRTKFEAGSFELKAGDILYLYTDGLTEANNPEGEMFRINRVLDALNINKDSEIPLSELDANVRTRIAEFAKDEPQFDDMTTLLYRHRSS